MMFKVILVIIQGWSSKGLRDPIFFYFLVSQNLKEKLGTHLRDNHAYTLLGDFELVWTLLKLGESKA